MDMSERLSFILQLPVREITRRCSRSVSEDWHKDFLSIAGPFFEAGGAMICMAEIPDYRGDLHLNKSLHRFDLLVQGRMRFRLGKEAYVAETGDLVCMPCGTLIQRTALEPVVWIYLIIHDIPLWNPLTKKGPSIRRYESADLMYILVERILQAHRSQDLYSLHSANESAAMLITLLQRELRDYDHDWRSKRLDGLIDIIDRIRDNPGHAWTRTSIARDVGMSERNLTMAFNRIFGTAPGKMINRIRMEHATYLLKESELTVEKIAHAVGYGSIISFSTAFKKYMGISPGKYRQGTKSEMEA